MEQMEFEKTQKRQMILQKTWVICLLACVCNFLWGSAFPCIKIGYDLFQIPEKDTPAQILFAGMRFAMAGILVILVMSISHKEFLVPKRQKTWGRVMLLSCFQTILQYILFYIGLAHTSGVKASIIEASNVFFAILVASLFFRQEKLTAEKIIGSLIGFLGVLVIQLQGFSLDFGLGDGCILLSTIAYAMSSVLLRRFSDEENVVLLSGYQFLFGGIVMMIFGFLLGGRISSELVGAWGMLFYLAFVSAMAYSLWAVLLSHNPVSRVAVFGFMNPVFGVILSAWLLKERQQAFGIRSVIALILVSIGIYIVYRNPKVRIVDEKKDKL